MKKLLSTLVLIAMVFALAACSNTTKTYDLENSDRARGFYNKYQHYVEQYGEGKEVNGALCGVAIVRLLDFTGDGSFEMLLGYSSQKDGIVDSVAVFGFDMGLAEILNEKISTSTADGVCIWTYTDSFDNSYIIKGEDLSVERSYQSFMKTDSEGNPIYKFAEAFSTKGEDLSGEYDRIYVTSGDFKSVLSETDNVVKSIESQKN